MSSVCLSLLPVALRKESVDRNMGVGTTRDRRGAVALRKESVDRNYIDILAAQIKNRSLSARRAWIEIGVDFAEDWLNAGRSPQGERG